MCGQFAIFSNIRAIIDYYNFLKQFEGEYSAEKMHEFLKNKKDKTPYNQYPFPNERMTPGMYAPILTKTSLGKQLEWQRWGLVPSWSKDDSFAKNLINARIESIGEKASFKHAIQKRRGLLPVNYFYEWSKDRKVHHIALHNQEIFSLGVIWEFWTQGEMKLITFSIITQEANKQMKDIHERMPLIINQKDYNDWLNCNDINYFRNKQEEQILTIS